MGENSKLTLLCPTRGEVWLVTLDPGVGDEMKKKRPVVVLSSNRIQGLELRIVVPVTTWRPHFKNKLWLVKLEPTLTNGLQNKSAADTFQLKSISTQRFTEKLGVLSADEIEALEEACKLVMEIT